MKPYLGWPWFSLSLPRADAAAIWVGHYRERRVKGVGGLQFAVGIGTTSTVTMISRVRSSGRPNTDLMSTGRSRPVPFRRQKSRSGYVRCLARAKEQAPGGRRPVKYRRSGPEQGWKE